MYGDTSLKKLAGYDHARYVTMLKKLISGISTHRIQPIYVRRTFSQDNVWLLCNNQSFVRHYNALILRSKTNFQQ